jgi:hypothetical protein
MPKHYFGLLHMWFHLKDYIDSLNYFIYVLVEFMFYCTKLRDLALQLSSIGLKVVDFMNLEFYFPYQLVNIYYYLDSFEIVLSTSLCPLFHP